MDYFLGIDGCRAGWVVASLDGKGKLNAALYKDLEQVAGDFPQPTQVFIDMPIGLGQEDRPREIEPLARQKLKPHRASSVFTPPCREALYQPTLAKARETNIKVTGKSLSAQSWNISEKIRELDQFLQKHAPLQETFVEAHPEICFAQLDGGQALAKKKATPEGQAKRLSLLQPHLPATRQILQMLLSKTPRAELKPDDILDAVCLALQASLSQPDKMQCLVGTYATDGKGLPMRICYTPT